MLCLYLKKENVFYLFSKIHQIMHIILSFFSKMTNVSLEHVYQVEGYYPKLHDLWVIFFNTCIIVYLYITSGPRLSWLES